MGCVAEGGCGGIFRGGREVGVGEGEAADGEGERRRGGGGGGGAKGGSRFDGVNSREVLADAAALAGNGVEQAAVRGVVCGEGVARGWEGGGEIGARGAVGGHCGAAGGEAGA